MHNQEATDVLGVSIIGADLAKRILACLDPEDREASQWTERLGGGDIPAVLCEQTLRHTSGRRSPEAISARG